MSTNDGVSPEIRESAERTPIEYTTEYLQTMVNVNSYTRDAIAGFPDQTPLGTLRDGDLKPDERRELTARWQILNDRIKRANWTLEFLQNPDAKSDYARSAADFLREQLPFIDGFAGYSGFGESTQKHMQQLSASISKVIEERIGPYIKTPHPNNNT